jgi:hypothetical protein
MDVFSIIVLIGFIGACLLVARIGAAYRPGDWYERLAKPRWRPPNWLDRIQPPRMTPLPRSFASCLAPDGSDLLLTLVVIPAIYAVVKGVRLVDAERRGVEAGVNVLSESS